MSSSFHCCDKILWSKTTWGRNDVFHPTVSSPSSKENRVRTQDKRQNLRQEPGNRKGSRGHRGTLLTVLLPLAFSVHFLIQPRITCRRVALAIIGWALPYWSLIKKILHIHTYGPIRGWKFHKRNSFFSGDSSLYQVGKSEPNRYKPYLPGWKSQLRPLRPLGDTSPEQKITDSPCSVLKEKMYLLPKRSVI